MARPSRGDARSARRQRKYAWGWLAALAAGLALAVAPSAGADDGPMVRHDVARTPELESEHAQLSMFQFYVDAQGRNGEQLTLEYYADRDGDNQPDELVDTRELAKPLLVTYWDEAEWAGNDYDITTGDEVGLLNKREAFGAISFDDGKTWKDSNLSESALESSFTLLSGEEFPGDVQRVTHAIAGNQILVAWVSKYCDQGSPRYSIKDEADSDGDGNVDEPQYPDLYDVAGSQRSIDYAEWRHHGEYPFAHIGEIPFSCVWTARGTVEQVTSPQTGELQWGVLWRKAERLTSGKRDAYYLAIDGVEGAGFALAWQEDPEGLRPGYGEGPGEGWSGATVNHKADIWYSFIGWDQFAVMEDPEGNPTLDPTVLDTNKPKAYERMAMPIRMTDNYNCLVDRVDSDGNPHPPFCFQDFDGSGVADFCAEEFQFTNEQGELKRQCVTEDGRLLNGQIGASRARMMLEGYTKPDGTKSAWVVIAYEESKGLGAGHSDIEPLDIGKDVMYHSFDMSEPDFVAAGHMLNLPETDPLGDPESPTILPLIVNDYGEYQYQTSIGRRPSLIVQPASKIVELASTGELSGTTSAFLLYKDGIDRQGGPSDIFARRFVIPEGFDPSVDNPYAVENLECAEWDATIPYDAPSAYPPSAYPDGVCLRGAINLSGSTPLTFEPLDNADDGELPSHGITERVLTWEQTPDNLDDESWVNRYDVAKGHRGFLDGDILMVMYAWSPNWLMTSHGHEPYNLYIRRSFDGGLTWTTTPAALGGSGTTYDQVMGVGDRMTTVTVSLGAGEFEPARNVSMLDSAKETVLDPRYSPTNIGTQSDIYRVLQADGTYAAIQPYPEDDMRDPSRFFAVYETGDASVVAEGAEAIPWDLFYSRATVYGDIWDTVDHYVQSTGLYEERWDWLENKEFFSGEASIAASPGGVFMWAVWNQWMEDEAGEVWDSDPVFRRLWWDDLNTEPVADAGGSYDAEASVYTYTALPGEIVYLDATASYDPDGDELTYTWDLDNDGTFEIEGAVVTLVATGSVQAPAVKACDEFGACDVAQGWVNANPHEPRVWKFEADPELALPGESIELSGRFTGRGPAEGHTALFDWGDGTSSEAALVEIGEGSGAQIATGSHVYGEPGVYTITLFVTDDDGNEGYDYTDVAVYQPGDTFVTGDGWTYSPAGSFLEDASLDDDLDVELVARYDRFGLPEGEVYAATSGFELASEGLDWIVFQEDGTAYVRGYGLVDGAGGYEFLLAVTDGGQGNQAKAKGPGIKVDTTEAGALLGANASRDQVRLKVWHTSAGRHGGVLYDNQIGALNSAAPTATLEAGNFVVHER